MNHPGVRADVHCAQCHRPVCEDCIAEEDGEMCFCSALCRSNYARFFAAYRRPAGPRGRWLRLLVRLTILFAALLALLYLGRGQGSTICDSILKVMGL